MEYFGLLHRHKFVVYGGGKAGMATHRLADILKSRCGLSEDEIRHMDEDEAWEWIRGDAPAVKSADDPSVEQVSPGKG
jgi:hypothetical protein